MAQPARTGRCSEAAHSCEHVLGRRLVHTEAEFWVSSFRMGGMPRFSAAAIRAISISLPARLPASPSGSVVRSGESGEREALYRRVQGRPAARNRLPERVSGFKWSLRGTGTRHAAAIFQFFTPGVTSA